MANTFIQGETTFEEAVAGLLPKQREFLQTPAKNAAYVGGQGSGKTISLCLSVLANALNDPHGFSLVGRLHMPSLKDSTMKSFLELIGDDWGTWQPSSATFTMYNGHVIVFKHLDMSDPKIVGHIKSMNLSGAYVDEATEVSEEVYFLLLGRLRRRTAPRHIIRLTSNPAGHDWVWRHFFDPNRSPKLLESNFGVTAASTENRYLPPEYIESMLSTYPPDWADRFIHGYFTDFTDLVYKDFREASHIWDSHKPQEIFGGSPLPPPTWPVIVGIDIGAGHEGDPWAVVFLSVAPDGRLYLFNEIYGGSLLVAEVADEYHRLLGPRSVDGMAYDYSNRQAAMELEEHRIFGVDAVKDVKPGLFKVAQYLHPDERLLHPFTSTPGSPRLFIASHCVHSINDLMQYKWAKDRTGLVKEEPSHEHSHAPDAIRYAIHTFRPLPERSKEIPKWQNQGLTEMSRLYWHDVDKHYREGDESPRTAAQWKRPLGRQLRMMKPRYMLR